MARKGLALAIAAGLAVFAVSVRTLPAAPPALEINQTDLDAGAMDPHVKAIAAYVKYWSDQLAAAKDEKTVLDARTGLVEGYSKYDKPNYQLVYAREAAKALVPLLDLAEPNKSLKQINIAIALARMNAASVQEALSKMAASSNPAVRLLAWKGYKAARTKILAQTKADIDRMMATLTDRVGKEQSPQVLPDLFQVFRLPAACPAEVPEKIYAEAQKQMVTILASVWAARCNSVQTNVELVPACRSGVEAWSSLGQGLTDKDLRKKALQNIVGMAWNAARAYETGKGSDLDAYAALALDCEKALNDNKKTQKKHIEGPLTDTKKSQEERTAALVLGVLKWAEDLKDDGVVEPKDEPAATSAPAAATSATTKP